MKSETYNMDCMKGMRQYPDNYFELAIVDPPYGINITSGGSIGHYGGKGKKWDKSPPKDSYFKELFRVSQSQIIWGGNYFKLPPTRCFLIWDKQQPYAMSYASCEMAWTSFDRSAKTFYMRPQNADTFRIHPTQKPVKLYEWILMNYATKGDQILDTHLGSGSSRIAAHNLGFDFVGFELDKDYFKNEEDRFKKVTSQLIMFQKTI
jgi:site-specific DNA-methyltransferase (adenine-specific)